MNLSPLKPISKETLESIVWFLLRLKSSMLFSLHISVLNPYICSYEILLVMKDWIDISGHSRGWNQVCPACSKNIEKE